MTSRPNEHAIATKVAANDDSCSATEVSSWGEDGESYPLRETSRRASHCSSSISQPLSHHDEEEEDEDLTEFTSSSAVTGDNDDSDEDLLIGGLSTSRGGNMKSLCRLVKSDLKSLSISNQEAPKTHRRKNSRFGKQQPSSQPKPKSSNKPKLSKRSSTRTTLTDDASSIASTSSLSLSQKSSPKPTPPRNPKNDIHGLLEEYDQIVGVDDEP
uniref:Uncharacterized protein n=1 Tax=Entomoneis paludosa TaxID=265537 RepID=A0A6U3CUE7_9STRA